MIINLKTKGDQKRKLRYYFLPMYFRADIFALLERKASFLQSVSERSAVRLETDMDHSYAQR